MRHATVWVAKSGNTAEPLVRRTDTPSLRLAYIKSPRDYPASADCWRLSRTLRSRLQLTDILLHVNSLSAGNASSSRMCPR